jgi:exonuclease SbcC
MIPIRLKLSGFLSYRDPVELDFTTFALACISGANGAGKSSLLDAITWAIFGQARKRDETLIHMAADAAEVTFTFSYEENVYRVQRILPRGKGSLLEFQIMDDGQRTTDDKNRGPSSIVHGQGAWRPLTEHTLRETQARIENILHLDYETFVNASFFLQGKADQFTQQRPADRKRILASILGLETWEIYRERTAERRKAIERELDLVQGRLAEINAELDEEPIRLERLRQLETQLGGMSAARKTQESALENLKRMAASLAEQRKLVEALSAALTRSRENHATLLARLAAREAECAAQADLVRRAAEVESAYRAWNLARADLEKWQAAETRFHEFEKRRQPSLDVINAERARLEQENQLLSVQYSVISQQQSSIENLKSEIVLAQARLVESETKLAERGVLQEQVQAARERQAEMRAENDRLKIDMDEIKQRLVQLESATGAACPLCGQALNAEHRQSTLEQLNRQGTEMGDRWRANKAAVSESVERISSIEYRISALAPAEGERLRYAAQVSSLNERLGGLQKSAAEWETKGAPRLAEIELLLQSESYAAQARAALASVDVELTALGYDAIAHESARSAESAGRAAEADFRALESAKAALAPIQREIAELRAEIGNRESEIENQEDGYAAAVTSLAQAEQQAPDVDSAYDELLRLQESENRLRDELGASRQKVSVLDDLRIRKAEFEALRNELAVEIGRHKALERAFGKDGVPALLIEQALPQIEEKANELLNRLSNDTMSVRFVTQAGYKDKKREDLKETLEIQISDGVGTRDYEMFSGGEAFRVNFAIRLALSEVLARRTGARLQTLVIDEGFGSQDVQGRMRLIEAINLVKADFAKILIITHLEDLKEYFPNRIEVEKTQTGSTVRVT